MNREDLYLVVNRFMMYCSNYEQKEFTMSHNDLPCYAPACFDAFGGMADHFISKWRGKASDIGGTQAMFWLWYQLDSNNRKLLIEWIDQNYKG